MAQDDPPGLESASDAIRRSTIKGVLARQLEHAMWAKGLSRNGMTALLCTSRSQIRRLLGPEDDNVTLKTLQRAAEMLGRQLKLDLV